MLYITLKSQDGYFEKYFIIIYILCLLTKDNLPGFVPIIDLSSCHLGILGSSV